ncbi:PREDICTED: IgGFc-binding protein-like, partial [Nipponia nippon]|uniref:IgGFc-binding protein-like n=1 Tax=Nipponia nippon TaxID=128390 RepID=UPI0005114654
MEKEQKKDEGLENWMKTDLGMEGGLEKRREKVEGTEGSRTGGGRTDGRTDGAVEGRGAGELGEEGERRDGKVAGGILGRLDRRPKNPSRRTPGLTPSSARPHSSVDGTAVPLPFCPQGRAVCVTPQGATTLLLLADFGLRVTVGPGAAVAVTLSPRYRNVTCGLCGNFDGHPYNDHLHKATTATTGATCHRPCPGPACPPCRQPPKRSFVHAELCSLLRATRGPFGDCHSVVHPGIFYDVCLRELCESPGDKEVLSE